MTRRVLTSSRLRTCILCGEKSLMPGESSGLSELILQECQKCIMCGSSLL